MVKKTAIILVIIVTIILVVYNKYFGKKKIEIEKSENTNNYNSNLLENVEYVARTLKEIFI